LILKTDDKFYWINTEVGNGLTFIDLEQKGLKECDWNSIGLICED